MAVFSFGVPSACMQRMVECKAILPAHVPFSGINSDRQPPWPTLYLLHGLHGDANDWLFYTMAERYARLAGIAIIMPNVDNSFYMDYPAFGANYGEFVGRELVEFTRMVFPLSPKREDTAIGGVSMGGYGALRCGLKYAENFSKLITFSAALFLNGFPEGEAELLEGRRSYFEACFGPAQAAADTDKDPRWLFKQAKAAGLAPAIWQFCGTDDFLLASNRAFRDFLLENGADLTYQEDAGGHVWPLWNIWLEKALAWLNNRL